MILEKEISLNVLHIYWVKLSLLKLTWQFKKLYVKIFKKLNVDFLAIGVKSIFFSLFKKVITTPVIENVKKYDSVKI